MTKKIILLISLLFLNINLLNSRVYLTKDQALKLAFPHAKKIHKKMIWFEEADIKKIEKKAHQKINFKRMAFYFAKKNGKITGYATIDNVIGKKEYITYMVVLTPRGKISMVEILVFREPQGWEIMSQRWRDQFAGKTLKDPVQLNKDIVNISGATLSSRAITKGVKKILAIFSLTVKGKI